MNPTSTVSGALLGKEDAAEVTITVANNYLGGILGSCAAGIALFGAGVATSVTPKKWGFLFLFLAAALGVGAMAVAGMYSGTGNSSVGGPSSTVPFCIISLFLFTGCIYVNFRPVDYTLHDEPKPEEVLAKARLKVRE